MEFIDVRKLLADEKSKNPQILAPLLQEKEVPNTFLKQLRRFIGEYAGIVISNHGFSNKNEYLVKITKKKFMLKIIKDTGVMLFSYDFESEKLYKNNRDSAETDLEKVMQYMQKIGKDLSAEKAYMWDIKKAD
jgi:hypothetical protein